MTPRKASILILRFGLADGKPFACCPIYRVEQT